MGAGASTADKEIVVGDIVTVAIEGHDKRVIGVVIEIQDTTCTVQVSSSEILHMISRGEVRRIASWDEIEVGDTVKVKEEGSRLYYEGHIISRNTDGTFKVKFDDNGDDGVEEDVPLDRIFKLMSGRLEQKEWMMFKEE
ncbi:hypothetical protein Poli38472_000781 [Pythium oligandrum]|uniref:Tudor domain-containing protein n=1 Tax=Pythium oligandrum TaxID=41045 RepID=A0A8K1CCX1_PYTOL|nr:hypothetical protein Poli38472_000781 [Pythium oligandrum]|eukprot:TMW60739.1 hypothetical protein Poli38472_000781 [Pythium oligandrum]